MAYTSNPYIGKTRRKAVNEVCIHGYSVSQIARYYGVHRTTVWRWIKRASPDHREHIRTRSSRPHTSPHAVGADLVQKVVDTRVQLNRCALVVYTTLINEGISISLSTVRRILKKQHLTRTTRMKIQKDTRFHRPLVTKPGDLVQMDTIHFVDNAKRRFYVYAVIDVYSRMAYVEFQPRISSLISSQVIARAQKMFPFSICVVQTDNGIEFGEKLGFSLRQSSIRLRHTRVRRPNDNAHVERFIRTIQEECFGFVFPQLHSIETKLLLYNAFYNYKRLHLGLQCRTPVSMLQSS